MLYHIVKPFLRIFLRVYYKLDYSSLRSIPFDKPIIFAPNHTNAFIDPIIIAMLPAQKVRFFARGDVFKGKLAKKLLNSLNISPIYRIQEGYSEIKKNDKTFEECRDLLSANKTILIFPEAICVQEKRLRPLKKGLSRIVFQTAESTNYKKDILVIPVGLNYNDAKKFRSKVYLHFGEPISTSEYFEQYKNDSVRTINEFTKDLETQMKNYLLHINSPKNDVFANQLIEMFVKLWTKEKEKDTTLLVNEYESSKEIVELINFSENNNASNLEETKNFVSKYFLLLKQYNLRDHLLNEEAISKSNLGSFLLEFIRLYLGFPIYIVGLALNFPPYLIAKKIADKKVKAIEFYASFYANLAMIFWLLYFGIQLIAVALVFKSWNILVLYLLLIPLLGYYVLQFYPFMKKTFGRWRLLRLVRKNKTAVQELVSLRGEIINKFNQLKFNYLKI